MDNLDEKLVALIKKMKDANLNIDQISEMEKKLTACTTVRESNLCYKSINLEDPLKSRYNEGLAALTDEVNIKEINGKLLKYKIDCYFILDGETIYYVVEDTSVNVSANGWSFDYKTFYFESYIVYNNTEKVIHIKPELITKGRRTNVKYKTQIYNDYKIGALFAYNNLFGQEPIDLEIKAGLFSIFFVIFMFLSVVYWQCIRRSHYEIGNNILNYATKQIPLGDRTYQYFSIEDLKHLNKCKFNSGKHQSKSKKLLNIIVMTFKYAFGVDRFPVATIFWI